MVGATDGAGGADTAMRSVFIVAGPKVTIIAPNNADSIPAGVGLSVSARAQTGNGVSRIDIRVQGESNWPTKLDTTISQTYSNGPRDVTYATTAHIPATPDPAARSPSPRLDRWQSSPGSRRRGRPSSGQGAPQPRVTQVVLPKSEFTDSVTVNATGDAITALGVIVRDSSNNIIQTDSLPLSPPFNANAKASVPLNLSRSLQGKTLGITAFAVDQAGRIGYAVPVTRASSEGTLANALLDTTLVAYGRTYSLPRQGTIGDIAVTRALQRLPL